MSDANSPEDLGFVPAYRFAAVPSTRPTLRFAIPPSSPRVACRTCKAPIHWIETPAGRRMPVNVDGTSHFSTCPEAGLHRKPKASPHPPLSTEQLSVLRDVYDGVPVQRKYAHRLALAYLERKELVTFEHGMRWVPTQAGVDALAHATRGGR